MIEKLNKAIVVENKQKDACIKIKLKREWISGENDKCVFFILDKEKKISTAIAKKNLFLSEYALTVTAYLHPAFTFTLFMDMKPTNQSLAVNELTEIINELWK